MSQAFLIPAQNVPQTFNITLAGQSYIMNVVWNDSPDAGWFIGFVNADTNVEIVNNIPLITGCDLLSGLDYLGFQGNLFAYTDGDPTAVPTLDNLGVDSNIYFVTDVVGG